MDKYAVIDIGTNSVRLLIATVKEEAIIHREKHLITTRMGQGVDENKIINQETIYRNLAALRDLKNLALKKGIEQFIVFGTSALRDAKNAKEFIDLVKREINMNVQIIDGQLEAQYAFLGAGQKYRNESIVVMDIGGGSTELIFAQNGEITNSISFNIGAVRMTERFIRNDPPLKSEIESLTHFVQNTLSKSFLMEEPFVLIGIGGTATALSQMKQKLIEYLPEKIHNSKVFKEDLEQMIQKLLVMKNGQRKEIVGLSAKRSDVITAGAMIILEILNHFNQKSFIVSDYDNLEGAIFYQKRGL